MSAEQVARDFISMMTDMEKTKDYVSADAVVGAGVLPRPLPAMEAFNIVGGLTGAFPDLKFEVRQVTVDGNQATVQAQISGVHTGSLSLPLPGMPSIPPTGRKVSVPDAFIVTVEGDKVSRLQVDSPADGGIPAMLAQLGANMPGM